MSGTEADTNAVTAAALALKQDAATAATDAELTAAVALLAPKAAPALTGAATLDGSPLVSEATGDIRYCKGRIGGAVRNSSLGPLSNTAAADVTGLTSIPFTMGARPIRITLTGQLKTNTGSSHVVFEIREGATLIADWNDYADGSVWAKKFTHTIEVPTADLVAGAHNFKVRAFILNSTGGTTLAGNYDFIQDSNAKKAIACFIDEV
jgi:hypothetical protein